MRVKVFCIMMAVALTSGCACIGGGGASGNPQPSSSSSHQVLRHVVLFKFKADTTPDQLKQIEDAFRALSHKLPIIAGFECGTDVSTENKSEGFTHCFLVTFRTEADRDAYLPNAEHKAFVALAGPHIEKVLVVDYWARQ